MKINIDLLQRYIVFFQQEQLLNACDADYLNGVFDNSFHFNDYLSLADTIHVHIKVADTAALPEVTILHQGAIIENQRQGYVKYAFSGGINFIFSSIAVSEEELAGAQSKAYPFIDHIGIDIRGEEDKVYAMFSALPCRAKELAWPYAQQGGNDKRVYCCHVQVKEKYWIYPPSKPAWEFAYGQLVVDENSFGCDVRPASPLSGIKVNQSCCGALVKKSSILQVKK